MTPQRLADLARRMERVGAVDSRARFMGQITQQAPAQAPAPSR